uniref:Transmembrane protein 161A n=1 Tax=Pavo cristatus TaxID=9049 RepID=A0A8C9F3W4_PAVCR
MAIPVQAVMGVQVVVSLLAASVMQKLAPHCSFARWLLCNGSLHRYKHPSEEELRVLAGKQRPKTKRMNGVTDDKPLSVPRDIDLHLDTSPITTVDALVLRYFLEYQWFVDFAVYATAVYIFTEGYSCLVEPQREMNLGVLWCLLTVFFSIKVFFMVMRHYFRSEEGGERSVCLTFAFFFLLLAMVVLVVREDYLEFGLEPGLDSVSNNLESILKPRGWEWTLPLAKLAFKLGLVALCSFLGACLTFPGLRLAQTHLDALRLAADRPLTQVLLHVSFLAPVLVVVMWIRPISRDFLLHAPVFSPHTACQTQPTTRRGSGPWWGCAGCAWRPPVPTCRPTWAWPSAGCSRCGRKRDASPPWRSSARCVRGGWAAGRLSATPLMAVCVQITRIYCYVPVVSLQYLGPIILTLHCALLLKTLGESLPSPAAGLRAGDVGTDPPRLPAPLLHRAPLVGAVPGVPSRPRGGGCGTIASQR